MAVVGLGYWGPNLIRNLHDLPEVGELWACDVRKDRLDAIVARYPATRATTQYDAVLANASIDAVLVATPISTHYELGSAALRAGTPKGPAAAPERNVTTPSLNVPDC